MLGLEIDTYIIISLTFIILCLGYQVGKVSLRRKMYFGNILIGTSILGSLMYGGYTWYDESFLAGFLFYVFLRNRRFEIMSVIKENKLYFLFFQLPS